MNDQIDNFFHHASSAGILPGLDRIIALLNKLGKPQQSLRFIHIAGTNGKGSTGCFCNALLAADGYKVGWFSTPHLVRRNESIRITDGQEGLKKLELDESTGEVSQADLLSIVKKLDTASHILVTDGLGWPSEFELMTAAALLHFARSNCDIVIWEAGMGGTDDATNIISKPEASIITALGYDHSAWLGSDIESIVNHKAGIIKEGCPVWLYNPADALEDVEVARSASDIISQVCQQKQVPLHIVAKEHIEVLEHSLSKQVFCDKSDNLTSTQEECYSIGMSGVYQPMLAMLAIEVCKYITSKTVLSEQQKHALYNAVWPARLELCRVQSNVSGPVLLDGAHNPQGCQSLAKSLAELFPAREIIFVTGILADKDVEAMLQQLFCSKKYHVGPIICTKPLSPRAMDDKQLAHRVAKLTGRAAITLPIRYDNSYNNSDLVFYEKDAGRAVSFALELNNDPDKALCVFGSLYLAGAVRSMLLDRKNEQDEE